MAVSSIRGETILRTLDVKENASGLTYDGNNLWHGIYGAGKSERANALARLVKQGKALEVRVEGIKLPLYMRSEDKAELDSVMEPDDQFKRVAIIAPLDNLLWERELISRIFSFDYTWEVYKPIPERRYGYYVLPVLYGDRFIARFEPGRDNKRNALIIKNWWWEPDIKTSEMHDSLRDCFQRFLKYLGAQRITVKKSLVKREGLEWLP